MDRIPCFLAPMAELSHRGLRELIEEFGGCNEYFTEMISAGGLLAEGPFEKFYIDTGPRPEKTVFQLVGGALSPMVKAAGILDKLDCAGIDINMGCSAPIIRKSGAGAAWMSDIDRAGELISGVRSVVKRRLSVKLRIGLKDDFEYLARFCRRLESAGADMITLHPRLITEKFKRRARWDYVSALKRELGIPVAGNGDIITAEELAQRTNNKLCGCDAVMVGRAAVRQPWIFAKVLDPALSPNIEQTGFRFLELLARYQPPEFHVSRAKRFFGFFCDNLKWGNFVKNKLNREETLAGIERVWKAGVSV
ncbi:MAG: tRNA-dihydrouridine synthase family protein [Treponema sp.]|jgi:tRNA-dihydrouridine synthase|nr:tRNA-dihydrouridine synthase family protein [Treponema sp.]